MPLWLLATFRWKFFKIGHRPDPIQYIYYTHGPCILWSRQQELLAFWSSHKILRGIRRLAEIQSRHSRIGHANCKSLLFQIVGRGNEIANQCTEIFLSLSVFVLFFSLFCYRKQCLKFSKISFFLLGKPKVFHSVLR